MKFTIDLDCFLEDEDSLVALAMHTTNTKLIDAIAVTSINNSRVIANVIDNECTLATTINKLAKSENKNVKHSVASCPRTSSKVLAILADETDPDIKEQVALNPSTSLATLEKLATDEDVSVKMDVMYNPNVTLEILNILLNDKVAGIRRKAFEAREILLINQ